MPDGSVCGDCAQFLSMAGDDDFDVGQAHMCLMNGCGCPLSEFHERPVTTH